MLREEMSAYSPALAHKPYFVVINKIDLCEPSRKDIVALRRAIDRIGIKSMCISAMTGEGIEALIRFISENLKGLTQSRKAAKG